MGVSGLGQQERTRKPVGWREADERGPQGTDDRVVRLTEERPAAACRRPMPSAESPTVDEDLPREIDCLRRHDLARQRIMEAVEMPDRVAEDLVMFIRQNKGTLSKNRRDAAFTQLTDDEIQRIERIVADSFEGFGETVAGF